MQRKYYIFDAQGKRLGRLAVEIARVLGGKNKVDYTPNIDGGDFAVVINSDGITVTGNKSEGKIYYHFSGYPGGMKAISFADQKKKDSRKIIENAVQGMLPKNKLRKGMLKRMFVYKDENRDEFKGKELIEM